MSRFVSFLTYWNLWMHRSHFPSLRQPLWQYAATDAHSKAGNLWLEAGKHTLRIGRLGRVGYPLKVFERLELRASNGRPEASIRASKTRVDVVRQGETFEIQVTSGGDN